jgi:hypothetical protein
MLSVAACSDDESANNASNNTSNNGTTADTVAPSVISTIPTDGAMGVAANRALTISFSEAMDPDTVTPTTFTVTGPGTTAVPGTVSYSGTLASFKPSTNLALNTLFRGSVSTDATDLAGNSLANDFEWSFTTSATAALGPAPVALGMAGGFVILAKSGIDTIPTSAITGDIGVSPIDSTALTGFSLTMDATNQFATSDAAGRGTPGFTELGAGEIGGLTLAPGLYKWGTGVTISTNVTLDGGPNDVWVFQIAGDVTQASGTIVVLSGGAAPQNIFWQSFGEVRIGTNAHMEGVVLCETAIILETGASVNGRLLAQTAVTLDQNTVTEPTL